MTTAAVGYEPVYAWVKQVVGQTHRTVGRTVAWAVLCIVVAQRVTPAALARALPTTHRRPPVAAPRWAAATTGSCWR